MPSFQYHGENGKGLLESALANPQQTFNGRYLYRTIFDKAAILLYSITKNHALIDGNKRIALTTMAVFMTVNDYFFYAPRDEAVELSLCVAKSEAIDYHKIWREVSRWVRARSISFDRLFAMPIEEQEKWLNKVGNSIVLLEKLVQFFRA